MIYSIQDTLSWVEVIDYTFLADSDMLWDPEGNTSIWAWADPLARQLLDSYYKIQRAKEEIQRLNIEIHRFVTYMQDEKWFLLRQEAEVAVKDPDLAFFIRKYCWHVVISMTFT
ncbi:hypothetical protein B0H13DRAFT_1628990 [Mycena leptocephala]|nr:hypothetical protein B0H13DRAFT_1628990 [Mycena leptocephala]